MDLYKQNVNTPGLEDVLKHAEFELIHCFNSADKMFGKYLYHYRFVKNVPQML